MRKTIKNFMFIKRKETAMMMIAVAIAIIGGVVVFDFFVSMGDGETVQLGMVMALSAYVIFDIICEGITFGQHFTLCLQMGVTRKNFLSSYVFFINCESCSDFNALVLYKTMIGYQIQQYAYRSRNCKPYRYKHPYIRMKEDRHVYIIR